jgi:hypothetical protein
MTKSLLQKNIELIFGNFKYDIIIPFYHVKKGYTVAVLNGKSGLIDYNGNQLTEFIYDDMSKEFEDESYFGVGWVHFENRYDKYCRMRLNGKWGLLDNNGNVIVDFKYSNPVQEWGENFIIAENKNNSYTETVMDKNGNIHSELSFERIIPHSDFAFVIKNEKYGMIDNNFNTIIECKYDCLYSDYDSKFISAEKDHKWGILDLNENVVIDLLYQDIEIEKYNDNYIFKVKYNDKYALFNEDGKRIA